VPLGRACGALAGLAGGFPAPPAVGCRPFAARNSSFRLPLTFAFYAASESLVEAGRYDSHFLKERHRHSPPVSTTQAIGTLHAADTKTAHYQQCKTDFRR
jgi:hypothetical protein